MKIEDIKRAWAVVGHEKGSFHLMQLGQMIEANKRKYLDSNSGYIVIALGADLEQVRDECIKLKRIKREEGKNGNPDSQGKKTNT